MTQMMPSRRNVLIGAAALAGCATLPRFAIGQPRRPLTFWIMEGDNRAPVASILEGFTAETGVAVDLQVVPWSSVFSRWTTSFEAGTGADVSQAGGMGLFPAIFHNQGRLMDLSDILDEMGRENYFSSEWGDYRGAVTSVPWFLETRVLYYRKDRFEEAGLEPPRTWEDLIMSAAALTSGQRFGIALPYTTNFLTGQNNFMFFLNTHPEGERTIAEAGSEGSLDITLDRTAFAEALRTYTGFLERGHVPTSVTGGDAASVIRLFSLGVAGMIVSNGSAYTQIMAEAPALFDEDRVGTVQIPGKFGPGYSFLGGSGLWVNAATPQPEEAKALVKYLNSRQSQVALAQANILNQPSRRDAQAAPELLSNPVFGSLATQLEKARAYLWSAGPQPRLAAFYGNNVMERPVIDVAVDNMTPEAATDAFAESVATTLAG